MLHKASHLATKLRTFMELSEREAGCLAELQSSSLHVKSGKDLVYEGQTGHWPTSFRKDGHAASSCCRMVAARSLPFLCRGTVWV